MTKLKIFGRIVIFILICFSSILILNILFSGVNYIMLDQGISLISLLIATKINMHFFEKKKMIDIGLRFSAGNKRDLLLGVIIPFVMLLIIFLFYIIFGFGYVVTGNISFVDDLLLAFPFYIFVAFNEEILFRGYIFQKFIELTNKYVALFLLSVCFGIAHLFNPNVSVLGVINIVLAGVFFSACYIKTNSLWLPISMHFTWNFVCGIGFGFPVSGTNRFDTLIRFIQTGPEWITGGSFGPEGGIIVTVLLLVTTLLIFYNKKLFAVKE